MSSEKSSDRDEFPIDEDVEEEEGGKVRNGMNN
jgi:hypothetical protein